MANDSFIKVDQIINDAKKKSLLDDKVIATFLIKNTTYKQSYNKDCFSFTLIKY